MSSLKQRPKRSQHFNSTYRNIVGRNMFNAFGHPVATCCVTLDVVGSNLKWSNFSCFICVCCMILQSFGQACATMLHPGMRTSSVLKTRYCPLSIARCNLLAAIFVMLKIQRLLFAARKALFKNKRLALGETETITEARQA